MLTKKVLSALSGVVSVLVLAAYSLIAQAGLPYALPYVKQANLMLYYDLDTNGQPTGNDSFSFSGYLPYYAPATFQPNLRIPIQYCGRGINPPGAQTIMNIDLYDQFLMPAGVAVTPPLVATPPFAPAPPNPIWVPQDLTFPGFTWANPGGGNSKDPFDPNNTKCRYSVFPYGSANIYDVYIEYVRSGPRSATLLTPPDPPFRPGFGPVYPDSYVFMTVTAGKKGSDSLIRFLWQDEGNAFPNTVRGLFSNAPYPDALKQWSLGVSFNNFGWYEDPGCPAAICGFDIPSFPVIMNHEVKPPKPAKNLLCNYAPGAAPGPPYFTVPQNRVKLCVGPY